MTENESEIVHALEEVTKTSLANDHSLLELCKVMVETIHLLEARLTIFENRLAESQGQILALSHFIQDKLRDEMEIH